jgi:hypothetical protein
MQQLTATMPKIVKSWRKEPAGRTATGCIAWRKGGEH